MVCNLEWGSPSVASLLFLPLGDNSCAESPPHPWPLFGPKKEGDPLQAPVAERFFGNPGRQRAADSTPGAHQGGRRSLVRAAAGTEYKTILKTEELVTES